MMEGVLFDMDGVLADSEHFMCNAAIAMFSELGVNAHEDEPVVWIVASKVTFP
jgi:beta-phosphoglucomutase-like phosphatase (HAD superfamily)